MPITVDIKNVIPNILTTVKNWFEINLEYSGLFLIISASIISLVSIWVLGNDAVAFALNG